MEKSSPDSTLKKLSQILSSEFGIAPDAITLDASFRGDFGLDSMEEAQLILEMEDAFGIEITTDEARKIFSVRDALNYASGS